MALAISTPLYELDKKEAFLNELVGYSSPKYGFEVMLTAFNYLNSLGIYNEQVLTYLVEASKHYNWQFKKFAKDMLEELLKQPDFKATILRLQNSN